MVPCSPRMPNHACRRMLADSASGLGPFEDGRIKPSLRSRGWRPMVGGPFRTACLSDERRHRSPIAHVDRLGRATLLPGPGVTAREYLVLLHAPSDAS